MKQFDELQAYFDKYDGMKITEKMLTELDRILSRISEDYQIVTDDELTGMRWYKDTLH